MLIDAGVLKPFSMPANLSNLVVPRNLFVSRSYSDFVRKKKTFVRGQGVEMVNWRTCEFVVFDRATWWEGGRIFYIITQDIGKVEL